MATIQSGDIVEAKSGRTYRVKTVNVVSGTASGHRVAVDAAGQWFYFQGALRPATLKLAGCKVVLPVVSWVYQPAAPVRQADEALTERDERGHHKAYWQRVAGAPAAARVAKLLELYPHLTQTAAEELDAAAMSDNGERL